jgi:FKBP-type peptidyl-prolyl cis-trans isomerase FkpA
MHYFYVSTTTNQSFMKPFIAALCIAFALVGCKKEDPAEQAAIDKQEILDYISSRNLDATETSSGLYYVIDTQGTGVNPTVSSTVTVDYLGRLTDGSVFDESDAAGATFSLGSVIEGWKEGIPLFKEGGSGILLIPSALGYGPDGTSGIPGNSVLVFDVSLLDVQ